MKLKNIFKKNQIIIFALAIMIAVAGYLNFAKDKVDEGKKEDAASAINDDLFADQQGDKYVDMADISDEDDPSLAEGKVLPVTDVLPTDGTGEVAANPEDVENPDQVAANPEDVAANPEEAAKVDEANPGEAILASTTISSSYFSTAKLTREQQRAKNKETLYELISNEAVDAEQKADAIDAINEMVVIAEKENTTEILLEAKGFAGAVVCIVEDNVDVIINSASLTDQDRAIIEDVVMRKTGASLDNIKITNVVTED